MDRLAALQAREKEYDSVEPCNKCGLKRRYTKSRKCVTCWTNILSQKSGPRNQARLAGAVTYETGKPCSNGHIAPRYTKTAACSHCVNPPKERTSSPRQLAKAAGIKTYQTGKPCSNGHIAPRYTSTGSCSLCVNPPKATKTVRVPNVHPQDVHALLAYATALGLARP